MATPIHDWLANGHVVTAPDEEAAYDGLGNLERKRTGEVIDLWVYDGLGRLKSFTSADAPTKSRLYEYNADGRLKSEDFGGEVTAYGYTVQGDLAQVSTPDGRLATTKYEYEQSGAKRRALPVVQRIETLGAESTERGTSYDDFGRVASVTEGLGTAAAQTTTFHYGQRGQLLTVRQPTQALWTYDYDALLRLTAVTPPPGSAQKEQSWAYDDGLGRQTRYQIGSGSNVWLTEYTGPSSETTTPLGEHLLSTVDGRGRMARQQFVGASAAQGIASKRYGFDGLDALVTLEDVYGVTTGLGTQASAWSYDTSHRLNTVTRTAASTVGYEYQQGTRLRSTRTLGGSISTQLGWTYDGLGRLNRVTNSWEPGGTVVAWEPGGQRLTTLGDESFSYDGRGWLKRITTPTDVREYPEYDGRGNRLKETFGGRTRQFEYDVADRLIRTREWDGHIEGWKLAPDGAKQEAKEWPASTQWAGATPSFNVAGATKHTQFGYSSSLGALQTITDMATGVESLHYDVDANGQVTRRVAQGRSIDYGWDAEFRLVKATEVGGGFSRETRTAYDGLGLRRQETLTSTAQLPATGSTTTTQSWLWAGENGEEEVAEGTKQTAHIAGFRLGDGTTRFHHDALGSVVGQTDGFSSSSSDFSAWGLQSSTGTPQSNAGFTGYRNDSTIGLNYAQQRWYDPVGQFVSRDPVGAVEYRNLPNGLGSWSYARLNSVKNLDPDGRMPPMAALKAPLAVECAKNPSGPACEQLRRSDEFQLKVNGGIVGVGGVGMCAANPMCAAAAVWFGRVSGITYTGAWALGLEGHNAQGGFEEQIPDPVTGTVAGVVENASECIESPGLTLACGGTALVVVPSAISGTRALARTNAARSIVLDVAMQTASLESSSTEALLKFSRTQSRAVTVAATVQADSMARWTSMSFTEAGSDIRYGETFTSIGGDPMTVNVTKNVALESGYHQLVAHGGSRDGKDYMFWVDGLPTNIQQIAEIVRRNPNYSRGQPLKLITCYGARCMGQELAELLGVEVKAASDIVDVPQMLNSAPRVRIGSGSPTDHQPSGSGWFRFFPGENQ